MKVILYARVSTKKIESDTTASQLDELKRFAAANGLEVAGSFVDTCTGRQMECREGLQAAILEASKIGAPVAVVELSRLSRSIRDVIDLLEADTEFIFTRTGRQMDRMMILQLAWVAEYESVNISRRVSAGIQSRFLKSPELKSQWGAGSRPGAAAVARAGLTKKADQFALSVGKLAWERRQAGFTWGAIGSEYMDMQIRTARGGLKWTPTAVKNLVERYARLIES
jgi:hypothetical protein